MKVKVECKNWEWFWIDFEVLPNVGDSIVHTTHVLDEYPEMEITKITHKTHRDLDGYWKQFITVECYEVED